MIKQKANAKGLNKFHHKSFQHSCSTWSKLPKNRARFLTDFLTEVYFRITLVTRDWKNVITKTTSCHIAFYKLKARLKSHVGGSRDWGYKYLIFYNIRYRNPYTLFYCITGVSMLTQFSQTEGKSIFRTQVKFRTLTHCSFSVVALIFEPHLKQF